MPSPEDTLSITPDTGVPLVHMTREFDATVDQLTRAHTDPTLFRSWVGPDGMDVEIVDWDATSGGRWRYCAHRNGEEYWFRGCFHLVSSGRLVQTFCYEAMPDDVALETLTFESLSKTRTVLRAQSLVDSFERRDAWLATGMETGVREGYAKLDRLIASVLGPGDAHRFVSEAFTDKVLNVVDSGWDRPAPPQGWTARDVVTHLLDWFPAFLARSTGVGLDVPSEEAVGLAARWQHQRNAIQNLLDDPAVSGREFEFDQIGTMSLGAAIDMVYTGDVFIHTWDLARATGQDETLDAERCAAMHAGMLPADDALRASGHFGPRVEVPADADAQTQLLGFLGRHP